MPKKKTETKTPVETIKHKDKRKNIPTAELRGFVEKDEKQPAKVAYPGLLYARDPSLDPQLVWKGKDALDSEELTVPAVPIYIQEKIHPQAIIEDVRQAAMEGKPQQVDLFADFNGIVFEELIEFYKHEANWANRMILGDSLLVMTSLAEKEGLKGKVQTIYIDPPYGIKFGSNWQVSTRKRDLKDGNLADATRQPEQIRAFRDTWELGIHSYLSYWRDRLIVTRDLLTESGSVFVQIGDENVHLVRNVMDEVFGSENFIALITVQKMAGLASEFLKGACDYVLWFAKNKEQAKFRKLFNEKILGVGHGSGARYDQMISPDGQRRQIPDDTEEMRKLEREGWCVFQPTTLTTFGSGGSSYFACNFKGKDYYPSVGKGWLTTKSGLEKLALAGRIIQTGESIRYARRLNDFPCYEINNVWTDIASPPDVVYVVQTSTRVIERCLLMTTDPGDLVLDPTCGSGTTAHVAEQWGRRWITVDTSRVALALARTRLMAAKFPYFRLSDEAGGDVRKGFVYKTVPHVTLKSIANNPDIKEGMSRAEIDAAIARHADTEVLYDQPFEDNKRIRVTGPFTVESLSPHRVIAPDEERTVGFQEKKRLAEDGADGWSVKMLGAGQFGNIIIDNLRTAGVQNYVKNERLKFDRLDVHPGVWIHATGEFTDKQGKTKRVAVCVGPEHGTVGAELVKEAAKEAVQGVGFDVLLVCGFAFDPSVSEETKRYGPLTVLPTKIHPDLQIDSEHLKKTGSAQLFTVFGEPDLKVKKVKDGKLTVEIKGLDVYDPTTGEIRSNTTDDIACWFIDTDYNGESFFVRHAYFTGGNEPYDKLKRALRAEIDEAAWSALYSTVSRPFDPPKTGKIAVKVINHYGDEVLKVYEVAK